MPTLTHHRPDPATTAPPRRTAVPRRRAAGVLLFVQAVLMFVPIGVLGAAVDWPASLDLPAGEMLPLLDANRDAVRLGYLAYLGYSLLFAVTVAVLLRTLSGGRHTRLVRIGTAVAVVGSLCRATGIGRWLVAMPDLATEWIDPATTAARRAEVADTFTTLNRWLGDVVGEGLGVSVLAAIALAILVVVARREGTLPRWSVLTGAVAAASLGVGVINLVGLDLGPMITVTTTSFHLWMMATGAWLALGRGAAPSAAGRAR